MENHDNQDFEEEPRQTDWGFEFEDPFEDFDIGL